MAKELRCGDVVDGCDYVVRGQTEDEVMRKGAEHARTVHGIEELDEPTRAKVQAAIHDA